MGLLSIEVLSSIFFIDSVRSSYFVTPQELFLKKRSKASSLAGKTVFEPVLANVSEMPKSSMSRT